MFYSLSIGAPHLFPNNNQPYTIYKDKEICLGKIKMGSDYVSLPTQEGSEMISDCKNMFIQWVSS